MLRKLDEVKWDMLQEWSKAQIQAVVDSADARPISAPGLSA